jgi:hypothetical protein
VTRKRPYFIFLPVDLAPSPLDHLFVGLGLGAQHPAHGFGASANL